MMTENNYVTISDVADYYMVSVSTVRAWVRDNKIPYLQVGKTYRFKLEEIDASLRVPVSAPLEEIAEPVVAEPVVAEALVDNPDQDI